MACHNPNPFEFALIISLVGAVSIFSVLSGAALVTMSTTIVSMILAGASTGAILAIIVGDATGTETLMGLIFTLIVGIKSIMGC